MKTLITPELADKLLRSNNNNRKIVKANLSFLKNEITSGRFLYNGESIIVSENGNLLDGQHRLMAIKECGVPIEANLVKGVHDSVMPTIDTGSSRTSGSVLSMYNIKNSNAIASMCKKIIEKQNTARDTDKTGAIKVSNQTILDFFFQNRELIESIFEYSNNLYYANVKILTPSDMGAYIYLFGLEDKKAKNFFREVMTGLKEGESNYSILLRDRLINDKISGVKLTNSRKRDLIMHSFRGFKRGSTVKKLTSNQKYLFKKGDIFKLENNFTPQDFK